MKLTRNIPPPPPGWLDHNGLSKNQEFGIQGFTKRYLEATRDDALFSVRALVKAYGFCPDDVFPGSADKQV